MLDDRQTTETSSIRVLIISLHVLVGTSGRFPLQEAKGITFGIINSHKKLTNVQMSPVGKGNIWSIS